jgi:hypothetical protein
VLLLLGATTFALWQNWRRLEQLKEASRADHRAAEELLNVKDWPQAVAYLDRSLFLWPGNADAASLLWSILRYGHAAQAIVPRWNFTVEHGIALLLWSADSRWLVVASANESLMVFDGATGERLERQAITYDEGEALLILPDGKRVLSAKKTGGWKLLSLPTLELLQEVAGPNRVVERGALSPDGTDVVTWQEDGTARICAVESGSVVSQLEMQLPPGKTYHWGCSWHPTFNRLVLVGEVFRPRYSEASTSEPEPHQEFLSNEQTEIIDRRDAGYFDAPTGKCLADSIFDKSRLMHAEFNDTGRYLLIVEVDESDQNREEWTYCVHVHYDFWSGDPLFKKCGVVYAQWIPGTASFAVTDPRGKLQVRDMAADDGRSSHSFGPAWSANMSWSRGGRLLVFDVNEQAMHLCDPPGDYTRAFLRFNASEDQQDTLSPNGRRWALSLSRHSFTVYSLPPPLPGREPVAGLDFVSNKVPNKAERWEARRPDFDDENYPPQDESNWLAIFRKSSGRLNALVPAAYSTRQPVWNDYQTEVGLLPSVSNADEPPPPEDVKAGAFRYVWTPPNQGNEKLQRWATALGGVRLPREGGRARLRPETQVEEMTESAETEALDPIWRELLHWWQEERPADRKPPLPQQR